MSQNAPQQPRNPQHTGTHPLAAGGVYLAVVLLIIQGVLTILEAAAALAKDDVYVHFGMIESIRSFGRFSNLPTICFVFSGSRLMKSFASSIAFMNRIAVALFASSP